MNRAVARGFLGAGLHAASAWSPIFLLWNNLTPCLNNDYAKDGV